MSLRFTLFLVLFLPVTLTAQDLLFEERFTDGQLGSEWRAGFNGNTMEVESMLNNPSGDGWVGKLGNHFSGGNVGATHTAAQFGDFYYEAKVYVPVDEGVYYGLEFRVDTAGLSSGYQFIARFLPGGMVTPRLRFRVRPAANPGMPSVIKDWEGGDIPGGIPTASGWHTLGVRAQGHRFWFYYDGEMLPGSPILDFTSLEGSVGAYVWDASSPMLNLYIDDIEVWSDIPTSVSEMAGLPPTPRLLSVYPAPLRSAGTAVLDLPAASRDVTLRILDLQGRVLRELEAGGRDAGVSEIAFDTHGLEQGVYLLRIAADGHVTSRLLTVLR